MDEDLRAEVKRLSNELQNLKNLYYKDNFSDLQIFRKKVKFSGDVGLYGVDPVARAGAITTPSGGGTVDAEARTAIGSIITAIKNIGITS